MGRDNGSVADQGVVNTRVRHQVGLELVQVDVECTIEPKGGRNGADDLGDQPVEVLVAGPGNIEVATADVVDSLIIDEEGTVRVLNCAVGRQHSVVGLNDSGRDTRGWVDGELQLALLAVLSCQALQEQSTETRTSTTAERVEDQETLKAAAVVCNIPLSASTGFLNPCSYWNNPPQIIKQPYSPATRRIRSMTLSTISLPMV